MKILKTQGGFLLFISCVCIFLSCEIANEKLEKKLIKAGGLWEIENLSWSKVQRGFNYLEDTGSVKGGFLHFYNNGNIQYQYSLSQNQRNGIAMWHANDKDLIIDYIDLQDIPMVSFPVQYQVQHHTRHEITLSATEYYKDSLNQEITTAVAIELKRRK